MASNVTRDHHNLRRNLNLNDNYISNDGGDEGIRITDAGLVGIGVADPDTTLEVAGTSKVTNISTTANALEIDATALTTGNALNLNVDDTLTSASAKTLLYIDYDKSGVTGSSVINATTGLAINMEESAINHSGSVVGMTGIQVDIDSKSAVGTNAQKGLVLNVDADNIGDTSNAFGIEMEVIDGGTDIKMKSSADAADYCSITTTTSGATEIKTVDSDAAVAHLNMVVDGNIVLGCNPGGAITLQENDASTYTPSAASDATTKAYVDTGDNAQYHFIKCGFYNSGTAKVYIPLAGADDLREDTNPSGDTEKVVMICPFDGSVETIWARSEEDCGSTVIGMHVGTSGEIPSTTATQTVTIDMGTIDTSYEFDFASAGTNTFSQGNILMFSVDPTTAMNDVHFMMVLKFDVST